MRQFLILLTILSLASCKKNNEADENPFPTGFVPASLSEMLAIKTVESIDTSTVPVFERRTSSSIVLYGFPEPRNQVGNSCTGWALGYGMMSYFYNIIDGPYEGSPTYIWNQLNGGKKKQGISIPQGMELLKTQGCAHTSYMPTSINYTGQPDADARANAENYKIYDYYRFDNINLERIKSFLRRNYPLPFGAYVDEGFGHPKASQFDSYSVINGEFLYKKKSGKDLGTHAMLIVGYDDKMGPNGAFKIMNSWGNTWANSGFAWIDYKMFIDMVVNTENKPNIFWAVPSIIRTLNITAIGRTEATIEGKADSYEGSLLAGKGICYSDLDKKPDVAGLRTFEGQGKGTFKSKLTGLTPGKKYYVRAYAITSTGEVKYGLTKEFNTVLGTGLIVTTVAGGNGQGSLPNQLSFPQSVFVDPDGNVYVSDGSNDRVQKWAPGATSGITVAGGNGSGSSANQINYPQGLFVNASGNVYVYDRVNERVQLWIKGATSGITVAGGNGRGSAENQFNVGSGIFVDNVGNIYVADWMNDRVQKWAPGATSGITVAGGKGYGGNANQLRSPSDVFVDNSGNLYVLDAFNYRVQKWAPGATSGITVAGGNGCCKGANQFDRPQGIFVDPSGNIFVADGTNNRIQKWAPGATSGVTVAQGASLSDPSIPSEWFDDVFVNNRGEIYVLESQAHRIQKWEQ